MTPELEHDLKATVRTIPDYPKPGILFRDITTLLGDARAFRRAVDEMVQPWAGSKIDKVAGIEARGFILGGAVAHQVSAGFVPIRKKGKLPHTTVRIAYSLEYGLDEMEMHEDAGAKGEPGHDEYMSTASLLPSPDLIDRVIATANAYSVSRIRVLQELPGNPVGIEVREIGDDAIALMAKHFPNPNFNRVAGLKRKHAGE